MCVCGWQEGSAWQVENTRANTHMVSGNHRFCVSLCVCLYTRGFSTEATKQNANLGLIVCLFLSVCLLTVSLSVCVREGWVRGFVSLYDEEVSCKSKERGRIMRRNEVRDGPIPCPVTSCPSKHRLWTSSLIYTDPRKNGKCFIRWSLCQIRWFSSHNVLPWLGK